MKTKIVAGKYSEQDSTVIARELIQIQRKLSVITPTIVVEKASSEASPLHKYFEWDDSKAAISHRLWQARQLIASVYISDSGDESAQPVRAFVSLRPDEDDDFIVEKGYVSTPSIGSRQNYQNQVIEYAKTQLVTWRTKFGGYKEFFGVVKEIDTLK